MFFTSTQIRQRSKVLKIIEMPSFRWSKNSNSKICKINKQKRRIQSLGNYLLVIMKMKISMSLVAYWWVKESIRLQVEIWSLQLVLLGLELKARKVWLWQWIVGLILRIYRVVLNSLRIILIRLSSSISNQLSSTINGLLRKLRNHLNSNNWRKMLKLRRKMKWI